jgi:hypothetical protein
MTLGTILRNIFGSIGNFFVAVFGWIPEIFV